MPPPLRYPSYRPRIPLFHSPPWLRSFALALLIAFLFTLPACPEPLPSEKADENTTEASIEKTAPPEEVIPTEEITMTEELVTNEDGGLEREPEQAPEDPNAVVITSINGTGSELPITYGNQPRPPNPREASKRFQDSWIVEGKNLDRIQEWQLRNPQTNQAFVLASDNKGSDMISLKLPSNLVAGLFLLVGLIGGQTVVQAQVFVLQGDSRFSEEDATKLQALLAKIQPKGNNLEITADTVSLKPATANAKVTLDLSSNAILRAGNNTLDFSGDAITVTAKNISFQNDSFEVKGANQTSFSFNANAQTITLERVNVHIRNGVGTTHQPNGFGNLILGYNNITQPTNPPFTISRTGSHNLVIGDLHGYTATAGIVAGHHNFIQGRSSSILGGTENQTYSERSVIVGGQKNSTGKANNTTAPFFGELAVVVGGASNRTYANSSTILGGEQNITGVENDASKGEYASVTGGQENTASGSHASVIGGQQNRAEFNRSFICAGVGRATTSNNQVICP